MAYLEESDITPVGYRLIDADHQRLRDLINKLHDVALEGRDDNAIESAFGELIDYTKTHFVHEETLMRKTAYPQFIPHKIQHDRLVQKIEDFRKRFAAGHAGLSRDTAVFFRTWFCDHIAKVDTQLGKWLTRVDPQA